MGFWQGLSQPLPVGTDIGARRPGDLTYLGTCSQRSTCHHPKVHHRTSRPRPRPTPRTRLVFDRPGHRRCFYHPRIGWTERANMPAQRNARSTPAEVSLAHLKSCLVNLPATLESLLVNLNTVSNSLPLSHTSDVDHGRDATDNVPVACPECCRRTQLSVPRRGRRIEAEHVGVPWLDRHAEQAQSRAPRGPRWDKRAQGKSILQRPRRPAY